MKIKNDLRHVNGTSKDIKEELLASSHQRDIKSANEKLIYISCQSTEENL
jgi:hypothetical protein